MSDETAPRTQPLDDASTLYVTVLGQGNTPVVFLHGLFGQGRNFTTVAKALVSRCDISVLLIDLPNHGRSAWTQSLDLDQMARSVAAELTARGLPPAVVVGHSLGGRVAMRLALTRPELVSSLAVVDIAPGEGAHTGGQAHLIAAMQSLDLASLTSRTQADQALRASIPDDQVRGFLLQNLRFERPPHGTWVWQHNLDLLATELPRMRQWPTDGLSYPGPTLWILGAGSNYVTDADAPEMRRLFPRVVTVRLKGASHWVHADQPEAFTETLARFIGLTPSSPV